jgi:hypothetical protein
LVDEIGEAFDAIFMVVGHVVCVLFGGVRLEQLTLCLCQLLLSQPDCGRQAKDADEVGECNS